ncbi:MAG TPA: hypothetical protein VHM69_00055, partial [Rubrobacter sp.]|nr:hypothetical protein [Rubrobacter sp.]
SFLGLHRNKKATPLVEGGASVTIKPTSSTAPLLYHDLGRVHEGPRKRYQVSGVAIRNLMRSGSLPLTLL